jgi:5-formaminoimidazole-4-carboxamide-1-beta-D-ribofuranosyl 5'-monophosphate synthetase
MLHENALGLSTIVWREFKERIQNPKRTARVILKRSDMLRFVVSAKSHFSLYLVMLRGELEIFLVSYVFKSTFTGFLRNPIRRTDTMSVNDELQHLALSKIVGKVPDKIRRRFRFRTWGARVLGEKRGHMPYLQGEDDTEIDCDA